MNIKRSPSFITLIILLFIVIQCKHSSDNKTTEMDPELKQFDLSFINDELERDVTRRFLNYVQFDTQSDEKNETFPSTKKQLVLARHIMSELEGTHLKSIHLDSNAYLTAFLPSNCDKEVPAIGFLAHFDTSPEVSGKNVSPRIIKEYDGKAIQLDDSGKYMIDPETYPSLKKYIGQTLITASGNTLLGADDKAGLAAIVSLFNHLSKHPEIQHGPLYLCFTPDEEIGRGVDKINLERFKPDFAYTIDGGEIGELQFENFNAAAAQITINGFNVHPGYAKDKMVNAINLAMDIDHSLPRDERPSYTENYEGYYHLYEINGNVEKTTMQYIIRDHDRNAFELKKKKIQSISDSLNKEYSNKPIQVQLKDQYYNMSEKIKPVFHIIRLAERAMEKAGIQPLIKPIRGGTDGARLSYMGIPCPNIFSGGHHFHSRYEYIPTYSMKKATEVMINIIEIHCQEE